VAEAAADAAGASLYAVIQPPNLRWHLPSTVVGSQPSDGLTEFLEHVDVAVAVHGYFRRELGPALLLGGRNRRLAGDLGRRLRAALPDYRVIDQLPDIPVQLRGVHPVNPVNRPRQQGVQLELPPRVRGAGADNDALVDALAQLAEAWA
jgi:phage replication-related protein YjqB (UPF0714/DUF867 family)